MDSHFQPARTAIYFIDVPEQLWIPLYTSTKTGPWYVIIATNMDTQKQDVDEKEYAKIAEKMTTQVTKQIDSQMNLSVQTVEKDIWQEVKTVKLT